MRSISRSELNKIVPTLTVYSRSWCHLCDEMISGLRDLQSHHRFELEIVDVDSDPAFEGRYGEMVPVLIASGTELCHYRLDVGKVNDYLSENR